MEFADIAGVVENVLEAPISEVTPIDVGNVNDVYKVVLTPLNAGDARDELYVKCATNVEEEKAGSEALAAVGINVPVIRAHINDAGNSKSVLITEMVRGVSLAELCIEDPHKAIEFFADAFVIFHSITKELGLIHGDFCLDNVIVRNPFTTPDYVYLDTSDVREGSVWTDLCHAAFTVDLNTKDQAPQFSSLPFMETFFKRVYEGNRRRFLSGKSSLFELDESSLLQDPRTWAVLQQCFVNQTLSIGDIVQSLPELSKFQSVHE